MRNRYGKHVCSTMGYTFRVLRYFDLNYRANYTYGGKGKVKQSRYRPGQAQSAPGS